METFHVGMSVPMSPVVMSAHGSHFYSHLLQEEAFLMKAEQEAYL